MPVRALVLYEGKEPDPDRFQRHVELCERVPGATVRHGRIFGSPFGEPTFRYYAEFEWADMDAFKQGSRSAEFAETGKDAMELGVPFQVLFAEVE